MRLGMDPHWTAANNSQLTNISPSPSKSPLITDFLSQNQVKKVHQLRRLRYAYLLNYQEDLSKKLSKLKAHTDGKRSLDEETQNSNEARPRPRYASKLDKYQDCKVRIKEENKSFLPTISNSPMITSPKFEISP